MNGIIILDKPKGMSSNYACRLVGKKIGEKKVGHLGTLDPLAEGVLPITLGKCTKLFDYYLKKNKTYIANFTFGKETSTLDSEGEILEESNIIPSYDDLLKILPSFKGEQEQLPPKYSAKKINGVRAYDLARLNIEFDLTPKCITIYNIELINQVSIDTFSFKIECSSGTYIRSIARDIAYKLNTFAFMSYLQRTKCGEFSIENAIKIDDVGIDNVISLDEIFKNVKSINLCNQHDLELFYNSGRFKVLDLSSNGDKAILRYNEKIISFGILDNGYFINKIRFI